MKWIHELVWIACAVAIVLLVTMLVVSLMIGANLGGMG